MTHFQTPTVEVRRTKIKTALFLETLQHKNVMHFAMFHENITYKKKYVLKTVIFLY